MPDKRPQILEAAESLLMSHRFHEVTVEDVAKKAGVGKGTIYRYFKDKEDLYHQIVLTGIDQLAESLEHPDGGGDPLDRELRCVVREMVKFFSERQSLFALMHTAQLRRSWRRRNLWQEWRKRNERVADAVADTIRHGMEKGKYRNLLSPKMAARLLLGMVRSALWHREDMPNDRKLISALSELFEKGICK